MSWELHISKDFGRNWELVATKNTADACKVVARQYHSNEATVNSSVWYRLYGEGKLDKISCDNTSWRMKWLQGNLKSRDEQAGRIIGVAQTEK